MGIVGEDGYVEFSAVLQEFMKQGEGRSICEGIRRNI